MSVTVTDAGPFEKLVTFTVSETDLESAKTQAARRLAKELKIPGFRPGRAPRPIVEATVGKDRLRSEAIDEVLPEKVGSALEGVDFELAVSPQLESLDDVEDGIEVSVKITTWPTLDEIPEIHDRMIDVGSTEVTDEELTEQIERIRDQFGSLEEVDRPSVSGDFLTLDVAATDEGLPVEEASASDLVYEVGSGLFLEGIDEVLVGVSSGDTLSFDGPLPSGFGDQAGREVTFAITVTNLREKVRPDLTDDWVDEVTEFESVGEMRTEMRAQLQQMKIQALANRFRERALEELVEVMTVDVPEAIVRSEMDELLHRFGHRLEEQELEFADYLEVTGFTQEAFLADVRSQAEQGVRTRLLLDAVADQEGLEVSEEEFGAVLAGVAARDESGQTDPSALREMLRGTPEEKSITGDILRNKALETILSGARPVDEAGNEVDLTVPIPETEADVVEGEVVDGDVVQGEVVTGEIVAEPAIDVDSSTEEE